MQHVHSFRVFHVTVVLGSLLIGYPAFAEDPNPATIYCQRGAWPLYRQWTVSETHHFGRWIAHIYAMKTRGTPDQRGARLERVLTDPAMNLLLHADFVGHPCNPQMDPNTIRVLHNTLDCGKLTVALAGYYAYRRGLPWMITWVRPSDGGDSRTASYTVPYKIASTLDYPSPREFFVAAIRDFSTGNYRAEPGRAGWELSDTVPVSIDRRALIPGCLFYQDGHVLILARIDEYGGLFFLDATTAASRDIYAHNGLNAVTGVTPRGDGTTGNRFSGCYRGFRAYRFPIAELDSRGNVIFIRRRTDNEMVPFGFSMEQYDKMWELVNRGGIMEGGIKLETLQELVRLRMRTIGQADLRSMIESYANRLLSRLAERERLVQAAWQEVRSNGSIVFPEENRTTNIFSPTGRWGAWSSAAFDADFRTEYSHFIDTLNGIIAFFDRLPACVDIYAWNTRCIWTRADVGRIVSQEKNRVFAGKALCYTNSAGQQVRLSLLEAERRLFDMSFDPNHPPELRWGASPGSPEAAGAPERATPLPGGETVPMREAYRLQAYYRTLAYREGEPSLLQDMVAAGFPPPQTMDMRMALWQKIDPSPPLVPRNERPAWFKRRAMAAPRQ